MPDNLEHPACATCLYTQYAVNGWHCYMHQTAQVGCKDRCETTSLQQLREFFKQFPEKDT